MSSGCGRSAGAVLPTLLHWVFDTSNRLAGALVGLLPAKPPSPVRGCDPHHSGTGISACCRLQGADVYSACAYCDSPVINRAFVPAVVHDQAGGNEQQCEHDALSLSSAGQSSATRDLGVRSCSGFGSIEQFAYQRITVPTPTLQHRSLGFAVVGASTRPSSGSFAVYRVETV